MKPRIKVLYSCIACGAVDRPVEIDARESHEDIGWWMESVLRPALGQDHADRNCSSPSCSLKIPMPKDADWVGQAPKQ